jgi:hypothetical protein
MKAIIEKYRIELLIILLGIILFIPFLGDVHLFDWDEVNFAEAAREMIVTGDYLTVRIDFEPFHEKPPLFIWFQVISMKLFGVNEFAARFPNAIIGIITLLILFKIGKNQIDEKFGLIWVLSFIGSLLPHFYFKTGIIDPTFNLFIFLGIYNLYKYYFNYKSKINKYLYLTGIFLGLAVLTKGPVGLLIPLIILSVFYIFKRKEISVPIKEALIISLIAFLPIIIWYLAITFKSGKNIIGDFVLYQLRLFSTGDAGHGQPFYYHFVVLLFGCFPSSILLIRGLKKQPEELLNQTLLKSFMIIMLLVVIIIFSIVKTKIVHYSSLTYFPITFLASYGVYGILFRDTKWKNSTSWLIGIIGSIVGIAIFALIYLIIHKELILAKINDTFTREILSKNVIWNGNEYLIGVLFILLLITSLILIHKRNVMLGIVLLFANTSLVISLTLPLVVPKFDEYLQGSAINYYKEIGNNKLGYLYVYDIPNYKYGHMFYSNKQPEFSMHNRNLDKNFNYEKWLFEGNIDKDLFIITKSTQVRNLINKYMDFQVIEVKNGIALIKRPQKVNI